ncbi:hypothetical protein Acr_08g0002940 [Actinidia rufa]|uniref:Uncharacterized protein n=1 Tax=Actinidia rufa TaxID=165716 RepID=A0A7J0EZN5_9ERIC|nr:hypothetical protein Acr_08g0002940 [Actinidia rufa]
MAASAKHFSFLFCLALFSTLHAHARDSQFFSKVTTPTTANPKETVEVPNNEPPLSKQEQDPNFIPDTQNGYGLYSQETDQFPPTTTTNPPSTASNLPYKTESEQPYDDDDDDKQAYVTNPQGTSDTSYNENSYVVNNSMEGYQDQERYQEGEEEYVP